MSRRGAVVAPEPHLPTWTEERLRRAALEALGPHGEPRARDALTRGTLSVEPGVAHWEGSSGSMRAHRVHLFVDAARLGAIRGAPAVEDAIRVAVAIAVGVTAGTPCDVLHDLVFRAALTTAGAGCYRDAPPQALGGAEGLRRALADYLGGAGEPELALAALDGEIATSSTGTGGLAVHVYLPEAGLARLQGDGRLASLVTGAVRDLVGDASARVVVHPL